MPKFVSKNKNYIGGSLLREKEIPHLPTTPVPNANTAIGFVKGLQGSIPLQGQVGTGGNFTHGGSLQIKPIAVSLPTKIGFGMEHSMKLLKNVNFRKPTKETNDEKNIKFIY